MNEQQLYVFNQYYIDFLKKIKGVAKEKKDNLKEARDILRAIRKNYPSMDKLSTDYKTFLETESFWNAYHDLNVNEEFTERFLNKQLYQEITIQQIVTVFKTKELLLHFLSLMDIFMIPDIPTEKVVEVIQKLSNMEEFEKAILEFTNEELVSKLGQLLILHKKKTINAFEQNLKEIEQTSLGSLAKEILKDINVEDIQNTIAGGTGDSMNIGNLFSALQDSNNGLGKVINTVSQSMISKLSSGQINQEDLLKDAMSLATKLPGMLPGGMGSQLGNIGAMLQQFQQMGGADFMKDMGLSGAQRNAAGSRMHSASRKQKTADRLRKKLDKHKENNIQTEVEEHHD